jgi:hypothetical protein
VTAQRLLANFQDFAQAEATFHPRSRLNDRPAKAFNLTGVLFEMQEDYDRAKNAAARRSSS